MKQKVKLAKILATGAHAGQKYGGYDYTYHLEKVVGKVMELYPESRRLQELLIVAWLHDIVEDTEATIEDLLEAGFPTEVVKAISAISKETGESYEEYLSKVKISKLALKVKIADTLANLHQSIKEGQYQRVAKYVKQLSLLTEDKV